MDKLDLGEISSILVLLIPRESDQIDETSLREVWSKKKLISAIQKLEHQHKVLNELERMDKQND